MNAPLVCASALLSLTSLVAQAPVPEPLLKARRAYMVNEAGRLKSFDSLANELRKWGRFELVNKRDDADVIIALGKHNAGPFGSFYGKNGVVMPVIQLTFELRDKRDDSVLWSETRGTPGSFVKHLRDRIEAEEKKRPR